jgi:RNA polymerase-binding transcription factor DksA
MACMNSVSDLLAAEHHQTLQLLASLRRDFDAVVAASRDTNADDEHDPEGATIAFERSQVSALVHQAERHLEEIDAACHRWAAGTYGSCERCDGPIGDERLAARPTARTCIVCAASGGQ